MNKLLVVTGGSKGIGRCIIERFAREGFDIATCSRKQSDLNSLKNEVEQTFQVTVYTHVADVTDKQQVKGFTDFVNQLNRPVDVLAGLT